MPEPELNEQDYLRQIELLARDVVAAAQKEGWQTYGTDPADATAMQRSVNELARLLRHRHFEGDGCVEPDRRTLPLGGAALFEPGETQSRQDSYRVGCARLGVDPRAEGWALWHTWDDQQRAHTMVTTALETTRGLLDNWAQGHDVHPSQPRRSQIRAVVRGWVGPITLSPGHAGTQGLGGR
ncbi:hypothetical protein [Actinoplanes regularis]|uniref:Uncharacterized protein n=1 Tax=Actinoplanes regularis TaxID=52697 RepID=A0A239JNX3_9ACTN|nr:hypothetical protein [Actinoplanes regularis]GIE92105.1 hypothetical protein Are01nite_85850 [Actinoplanes regularis]SNT07469.1 hypothetical protein SAMN06264365_13668 [Actinoplanes regularis]